MQEQESEFYIGWQAEAPPGIARLIRRFLLVLAVLVPVLALLIVGFQRGFSNGTFEYGKTTELEGILTSSPVPFLTIYTGNDAAGNPVLQKILLVAAGKFGFEQGDGGRWKELAQTADKQPVRVSGFLIYRDGKTALEVDNIQTETATPTPGTNAASNAALGIVTLRGEIADPKCLFGVMKPGAGKPHRDCAARCIAGGIPPLLKVENAGHDAEYYLLVGPNGEALNSRLLEFAADGVQVCGQLEQQDDWLVLYADPGTLQRVNKYALNPGPLCH